MTLGEKLRQARLEAGLSQKAVCGNVITRNMLSQIENGSANPSMATLQHLAAQLGKPVGYFLGDAPQEAPASPLLATVSQLERVRHLQQAGKNREALQALQVISAQAEHLPDWVRRQYVLLLPPEQADVSLLPSLDGELLLRAQAALERGQSPESLLLCCENRDARWQLLMGRAQLQAQRYGEAAQHLHQAEDQYPHQCAGLLEVCYRELGNFEKAYYYACRGRNLGR